MFHKIDKCASGQRVLTPAMLPVSDKCMPAESFFLSNQHATMQTAKQGEVTTQREEEGSGQSWILKKA